MSSSFVSGPELCPALPRSCPRGWRWEGSGSGRGLCWCPQPHGRLSLSLSLQDNDTCEEWERHEALHEDVTQQQRERERLFEEEIELKWEKGGSGLVFYTDAQFWQEQDGGDLVFVSLSPRA